MPYFQHSALSIISLSPTEKDRGRERERERGKERERGRNWRGDKETHSMDYTGTYTHKYAYAHAGTHCMKLCLISLVVYQGDQEFNIVKFPVDKTLFWEAGSNECWAALRRRRRKRRRKNWRRWEEDDKRALWFNCLPDTFLSSLSSCSHLLQQMRKLHLTQKSCLLFALKELKVYDDTLTTTVTSRSFVLWSRATQNRFLDWKKC